ncbi:MAG: shikimate dehydrogenase [Erysipelotrichaceae bacterium]|nr:shikimate dehydrogenase [Erysipelotrichaceae bacterium]MDY5252626.1 shikimate kinase [Erysipelotrichaceae bacterium]
MRGLIGYPLGHSYSPMIHEFLSNKPYKLIALDEESFHDFMQAKRFASVNVTIPYKQMVMPYLDHIDELALRLEAVNCIVNHQGQLYGYNSDYFGFKYMLEHHGFDLYDKKVAILGNGGACKAVKAVAEDLHARKIWIVSRQEGPDTISYASLYEKDPEYIINTTPVGMFPHNDGRIVALDKFNKLEGVVDIVYNPLRTNLCIQAHNRNIKYLGGLEMLVAQAFKAVEIFDDNKLDLQKIDECLKLLLKQKQNIVLIGMPSCGKSTIASSLSQKLGKQLYEMDEIIQEKIEMPIKDYIMLNGEQAFRKQEEQVAQSLRNVKAGIISCGGGIVTCEASINYLQENGLVIFIDRDLAKLACTDDRPLSNSFAKLQLLYQQRYALYRKYSDITITNNGDIQQAIDAIIERVG